MLKPDNLLQQFIEQSPHAVAMLDKQMRYIFYSTEWAKTAPHIQGPLTGLVHYDVFPDTLARRNLHKRCLSGATEKNDAEKLTLQGQTRWFKWQIRPWYEDPKTVGGLIITTEEITDRIITQLERAQHEAVVRESEQKFSSIYVNSPLATALLSFPDGRYVDVNLAWSKLFGFSKAEVLGKKISEIPAGKHPGETESLFQELLKKGTVKDIEVHGSNNRGIELTLLAHASVLEMSAQKFVLFTHVDITEKRETERQFVATFNQAAVGIAHVAPHGQWLRVNPKLLEILGYSQSELVTRTIQDLTYPDDLAAEQDLVEKMFTQEINKFAIEKRLIKKDGTIIWVNLTVALVWKANNEPDYFIRVYENIQQRKEAQFKMVESEAKFSAIFGHSPISKSLLSWPSGKICEVNRAWQALFEYQPQEVLGKPPQDIGLYQDPNSWIQVLQTMTEGKEVMNMDLEAVSKSGRPLQLKVFAQRFFVGEQEYALVSQLDITGKVILERQKLEVEERERLIFSQLNWQRAIVDGSNFAIISMDIHGRVKSFNPAAERLLGYKAEEIIDKQTFALWQVEKEVVARAQILTRELGRNILPGPEVFTAKADLGIVEFNEWTFLTKSQEKKTVKLAVHALKNSLGEISGYVQTIEDISEQKLAEAERDVFFNTSLDMCCTAGFAGHFERVSPACTQILGYTPEEFCRIPYLDLLHPDDVKKTQEEVKSQTKGKSVLAFENRYRAKNGEYRWLSWRSMAIGNKMYGIARDVTEEMLAKESTRETFEREKAEMEIREKAAQETAKLKAEFLANMSHEIRTPLNGIIGLTGLLQDTNLEGVQREYAENISRSGKALLAIVNDILDFSKIDAGKLELEEVEFDLIHCMKDLLKSFDFAVKQKQITLTFEATPINHYLIGDNGRIGQVVLNLVSNAIKFTKTGGIIVKLDLIPRGKQTSVILSVADTGIGIPNEAKERMFQAFSQAEKSTTRNYGGTGLGLSISKRLIEKMGGTIEFESQQGLGTTFTVKLSLPSGKTFNTTPKPSQDQAPSTVISGRILIAEDNVTNQLVLMRMLDKWGCKYHVVGNGKEALDALHGSQYDLVLMDCQMPVMDGYEATRMIRSSKSLKSDISIVALTANAISGDEKKCFEAGMTDYITKPIDRRVLEATLRKYLPNKVS